MKFSDDQVDIAKQINRDWNRVDMFIPVKSSLRFC